MRTSLLFATLMLTGMLTLSAQNPPSQSTADSSGTSTLTGCLKGSKSQYYVVDAKGNRYSLISKGHELGKHLNHEVTVTGKSDPTRDPASGSDAHGGRNGLFSVDSVSDQGACKKK